MMRMRKKGIERRVFAQRLALMRWKRKMSQLDLANKTGLKPSAVSHFETGRRTPTIKNLILLCNALKISADFLIGTGGNKV